MSANAPATPLSSHAEARPSVGQVDPDDRGARVAVADAGGDSASPMPTSRMVVGAAAGRQASSARKNPCMSRRSIGFDAVYLS